MANASSCSATIAEVEQSAELCRRRRRSPPRTHHHHRQRRRELGDQVELAAIAVRIADPVEQLARERPDPRREPGD
jgi:hypothetical protein